MQKSLSPNIMFVFAQFCFLIFYHHSVIYAKIKNVFIKNYILCAYSVRWGSNRRQIAVQDATPIRSYICLQRTTKFVLFSGPYCTGWPLQCVHILLNIDHDIIKSPQLPCLPPRSCELGEENRIESPKIDTVNSKSIGVKKLFKSIGGGGMAGQTMSLF